MAFIMRRLCSTSCLEGMRLVGGPGAADFWVRPSIASRLAMQRNKFRFDRIAIFWLKSFLRMLYLCPAEGNRSFTLVMLASILSSTADCVHMYRIACQGSVAGIVGRQARRWGLSADCLEQLGEALLDFNLPADLHAWLQSH